MILLTSESTRDLKGGLHVGTGNKLEIWDKQEYMKYCEARYNPETLSKQFASLGVGRKL